MTRFAGEGSACTHLVRRMLSDLAGRIPYMYRIPVIPISNPGQLPQALQQERDRHLDEIRRLAYTLYCERGQVPGHEAEDWRQAESRLDACPVASTEENGDRLRIVTRLRPSSSEHLHVTAFPHEIFVKGGDPKVFERFPLPLEIEPASVEAALEKDLGSLWVPPAPGIKPSFGSC